MWSPRAIIIRSNEVDTDLGTDHKEDDAMAHALCLDSWAS